MNKSYEIMLNGTKTTLTLLGAESVPSFSRVTSVIAVCFTETSDIVAVKINKRGWDLPGGHVENGEKSPLETLEREVLEEAHITVEDPLLVEVIESDFYDDETYMLVYAARVSDVHSFVATDEVSERRFMKTSDFIDSYEGGSKKLLESVIQSALKLYL